MTQPAMLQPALEPATRAWCAAACEHGFTEPDGAGVRRRDELTLRPEGAWVCFALPAPGADGAMDLGAAGPWRLVRDGSAWQRVLELPCSLAEPAPAAFESAGFESDGGSESAEPAEWGQLFDWAFATRSGSAPSSWSAPPLVELEGWIDSARLTVRSSTLLAKGSLTHEARRLSLRFDELARVPEELSEERRAWIDELLLDARSRWRLVRFGVEPTTGRVCAEVDLTGVPSAWARPIVQLSLESLTWAVEWVLSPLSFLADPRVPSRALERHTTHTFRRRTQS